MDDIVGIIPARYHSTRLPGKPLADIAGQPMIVRVLERARRAQALHRVVVATDDPRIEAVVEANGGDALMTAPGHASGTDRVAEAARILGLGPEAIVVNIQGDEPLLAPEAIDHLVARLAASSVPMATLACAAADGPWHREPGVVKVVCDLQGMALYFSRAPIPANRDPRIPAPLYKHLGIYGYRNRFLQSFTKLAPTPLEQAEKLEQLRALEHGFQILVVPVTYDSVSVDTPEDLARVRQVFAAGKSGLA